MADWPIADAVALASAAGEIALRVVSASGQTADLQRWETSAGLVAGRMLRPGTITPGNGTTTSNFGVFNTDAGAQNRGATIGLGGSYDNANAANQDTFAWLAGAKESSAGVSQRGYFAVYTNGTDVAERFRVGSDGQAVFRVGQPSQIAVAVRGAASQASNLQEWQTDLAVALSVVDASGRIGIGVAVPHAPLQLAATLANRKVVLREVTDNDHQFYGFGAQAAILRYQVDATASSHVFYAATSSSASTELVRFQGDGRVIITGPLQNAGLTDLTNDLLAQLAMRTV